MGCFFVAIFASLAVFVATIGGLIATALGLVQTPGAVQAISVGVLIVLFILAITARRTMRRFMRPIGGLIEAASRVEAGDYSAQVPESGPPYLRSVARAFNAMSARLKATDEQRRSFLADVAHEMRTPMTVIRGQAEAIADGVYPGDAAHLAPILDATQTLDRLVEDLRTLVLTDAGSLVLQKEPTDLGALAVETVDSFKVQAEAAGVALRSDIANNLPSVLVDPARIRGVIGNLLSNAIRHTPAGGSVTVHVSASGDGAVITVADSGEGIRPELLPHVFERFVKGAGSPGSGLGLAIVHDIVTAHGGKVEVESKVGSGTRVRLTLPTGLAI
jgi:two-component system sensor histidine kinase BaeS